MLAMTLFVMLFFARCSCVVAFAVVDNHDDLVVILPSIQRVTCV